MATISETELQRRLRALERSTGGSQKIFVSGVDPSGTGYVDGDTHYNSVTGNLWLFSNGSWGLSVNKLHIRYATAVTNLSTAGIAPSQGDVTGFSELPYTAAGVQRAYRGLWFGGAAASTDPTDYEWTLTAGVDGYTPVKGTDYDDGIDGNNIRVEYSVNGTTWVTTQVSGTVYLYIRTCQDTNNNGVYVCGIVSKFIPEKGVEYDDGGTVAQLTIYKRSSTALNTPTGGQYAFATHTLTAPTGWTTTTPVGTDPVYSSVTLAHIIGNTGTDTTLTWSSPEIIVQNGATGATGTSVYTTNVFLRQSTTPGTPVTDTGSFNFGSNTLTAPTGSPSTEIWTTAVPTANTPLWASEATFSIAGDTGTDSTVDWGTPRIIAKDGIAGLTGLSTYLFSVFKRSATAPSTPTGGQYNFTTNTPTAPTGWSITAPSGTDPLYVSTVLTSTSGPTGIDSTLTWSSPVIMARDGYNPIKGTDYDDGIAGNNVRVEYSTDNSTWVTTQAANTVYLYIRTAVDTNGNGTYVAGLSTKFVPVKGVEYDDGDPGTDAYVHIKYSNNGTSFTANSGETVGSWIGTLADSTLLDSTTFSDYSWKLIVGADGYTPIKDTDYFDGTSSYLHIKYSNDGTTFTPIVSPYTSLGETPGSWLGTLVDQTIADSTTFSDYTWKEIVGDTPTFERYYSNTAGLASEMGDPTTPGTGITWIITSGAAPSSAYWIAERYTLSGITTAWQIYPVKAKDSGIPFVTYTKAGFNKPVLGDSVWIADAVAAVSAYTGRSYTNQKEFGYGTVVVIEYDDGKLSGRYIRSVGVDTWVAPASFVDGDLIVDGTIASDKIQANAITSDKIYVNDTINILDDTSGAILSGKSTFSSTDDGFFLGIEDSIPKFSIGSSTQGIKWDGVNLSLLGDILTSGNIVSLVGSKVSTKRYILNGTLGRVDATLGGDNITAGYWQVSDDIEVTQSTAGVYLDTPLSNRYLFDKVVLRDEQVGRGMYPKVLDESGVLVPDTSYIMEYQTRGSTEKVYLDDSVPQTDTDGMYQGGSMYKGTTYEKWTELVEGTIFTDDPDRQIIDIRLTHTGSETLGNTGTQISLICYSSGVQHDIKTSSASTVVLGSSDFEGFIYNKIEVVQATAISGSTPILCTVSIDATGTIATIRSFNTSGSSTAAEMFITVRGY